MTLLENRDTDFRRSDVNVVVDNLSSMTIADFKKQAKQKHKEITKSEISKLQNSKNDDSEDVSELDQLMFTELFDESDNKDNTA